MIHSVGRLVSKEVDHTEVESEEEGEGLGVGHSHIILVRNVTNDFLYGLLNVISSIISFAHFDSRDLSSRVTGIGAPKRRKGFVLSKLKDRSLLIVIQHCGESYSTL